MPQRQHRGGTHPTPYNKFGEPVQMQKLLADGKTDLLKEFVSNRTRRKFSAYLVAKDGKVGFEFEKKVAKPKAPAKKKTVEAE